MKYEDIETPEELLSFMNEHISYGFVDDEGEIYDLSDDERFEEGVITVWRLSTPKQLLKKGYGHCWDQVEFERAWFLEHGYDVKTCFILFEIDHENPFTTHTYLVYEKNDKFYLFEHADGLNRGISGFASYRDAVFYQMKNHIKVNNDICPLTKDIIECLHVYEYGKPEYGIDFYQFMDFVFDEGEKIL